MKSNLDNLLEAKFNQYRLFLHGGPIYSAITILGEIHNCIPRLDRKNQKKWKSRVHAEKISEISRQEILSGIDITIQGLRKILSVSGIWIEEEIILFLTNRIQLDLVISLLLEMHYLKESIDVSDVDHIILQISKAKDSRRAFADSVRMINKNWGLPISNKWLEITDGH